MSSPLLQFLTSVLIIYFISSILSLGLNIKWGWAGEFDLAYYAFVAIGAYMGAVTVLPKSHLPFGGAWILGLHQNFVVGMLVAVTACAVMSLAVGALALRRLRGDYFAITTLAFVLITTSISTQETRLFNGFNGVFGLPQPFDTVFDPFMYQYVYCGVCFAFLVVIYVLLELLYRSPFGRTLRMIREDDFAAAAFGRNVFVGKLQAYVLGGVVAGIGGFLYSTYITSWNPSAWSAPETFILYSAIFLGGQGNQRGVLLGTFIVIAAIDQGTLFLPTIPGHPDLVPAVRFIASGILLILVLRFRPRGLIPEVRPLDRARARGGPTRTPISVGIVND